MTPNDWTEERVDVLKSLWAAGRSCAQIARELGGTTGNAVNGKALRLGLPRRSKDSANQAAGFAKRSRSILKIAGRGTVFVEAEARAPRCIVVDRDGLPGTATILTLDAHMCKWPIGDPDADGFTFCGRRREHGPYCSSHAERAFVAPPPRKPRVDASLMVVRRRFSA